MPSAMFSATLIASNSEKCWNTIDTPASRAASGPRGSNRVPSMNICPESGVTRP